MLGIDPLPHSVTSGPSVASLLTTYRATLKRSQALVTYGQGVVKNLHALQRLGGLSRRQNLDRLRSEAQLTRLAHDIRQHTELLSELSAGRLLARPSTSKPFDLDVVEPSAETGLGIAPLVLAVIGIGIVGATVVTYLGTATHVRQLENAEFLAKARLIEKGIDISQLPEPRADFSTQVSTVTTPIALAVGAVALYGAVKVWKGKP